MNDYRIHNLKIDEEFKNLIPPLSQNEYEQLKQNLVTEGCRDAIVVWSGIIIDGHNRYEICHRFNISFEILKMDFNKREDVIAWICTNQLCTKNISDETKRYLIGKRYDAEKITCVKYPIGNNLFSENEFSTMLLGEDNSCNNGTALQLGKEYCISQSTIYKYGVYARTIDIIFEKDADIARKILSGKLKISHENLIELSRLPKENIKNLNSYLSCEQIEHISYSVMRHELQWKRLPSPPIKPLVHTNIQIKQMPKYDPDADISSLMLTIPSWVSSIKRTRLSANLRHVSDGARNKLQNQLVDLKNTIESMLNALEEKK
ncbi:hypothetical protein [Anaerocolumna sp. MB42-C2]|uniref:hypothetical protein n=1 Tax=Anaerocolumna sp. MB42-C2 TaxID=3070997 RepID=UPI0027E0B08C|nr:hypothetical protein [Anaerocolumna sp. MB42-C2]WMJ87749.1 hypothetical protein RBU59_27585 [Anaerocolumna sp. MB42-C2]